MENNLVVVSGLPRSGTSMMMGALQAGGLDLVTDRQREADLHNQKGYFEHEDVKTLEEDSAWLTRHRGEAVKIIYRQLYYLPSELPTKIIFMRRDVREVVASQNAMLGEPADVGDWSRLLMRELVKVDRWLSAQPHIQLLNVAHRRVFEDGETVMREIASFLNRDLDTQAMLATVRPELYRQRAVKKETK